MNVNISRITQLGLGFIFPLLVSGFPYSTAFAAPVGQKIDNAKLKMTIKPRSANQMAAFYEGREFPLSAIQATRDACFFTVGIRNRLNDILWHDIKSWKIVSGEEESKPLTQDDWKRTWQQRGIEQRFQSTFRWTLLPDSRDLRPGEQQGGNITVPRSDKTFSLLASFDTGENRKGKTYTVRFNDLRCLEEPSQ